MHRKDREVTELKDIENIIEQCTTCHVAMFDCCNLNAPYIVPLSFGYKIKDSVLELYFHCAHVGKKLDCIRANSNVSFSMCKENYIEIHEENLCRSGRFYASVIGTGNAQIVEDVNEKIEALSLIMQRHAQAANCNATTNFEFKPEQTKAVTIIKITSDNFTGKQKLPK